MKVWSVIVVSIGLAPTCLLAGPQHRGDDWAMIPPSAQTDISASIGSDLQVYRITRNAGYGYLARNPVHNMVADFGPRGIEVKVDDSTVNMTLLGYRDGKGLRRASAAMPRAVSNRVEYDRGPITEWYVNGPMGLEQGFTITRALGKSSNRLLTLAIGLSGNLSGAVETGTTLSLNSRNGEARIRYTGLSARDADGKSLQSWLELDGDRLLLRVKGAGSRYPLTIDPVLQLAKLTPSDGENLDGFGISAAVSGNTIVIGANCAGGSIEDCGPGAAYVFVKPASGWKDMTQTAKLTASDGDDGDNLGISVGISGNTVVAGADFQCITGKEPSKVYVFVEPVGGWKDMTQTAELTPTDGEGCLGYSVGISGNTVVSGEPYGSVGQNLTGAAYVFVRPVAGWHDMTETAKLIASDGQNMDQLGTAVAISGNTVVAGAPPASQYQGAVYVFVKPTGGWNDMTETAKLTETPEHGNSLFGASLAIDSNTVVVGEPGCLNQNDPPGNAYVFVEPANGWVSGTETAKLIAPDKVHCDEFPSAVAISGSVVVVSEVRAAQDYGAAYAYVRPSNGWQTTSKPNGTVVRSGGEPNSFGYSVGVAGCVAVIGQPGGSLYPSAAFLFGENICSNDARTTP